MEIQNLIFVFVGIAASALVVYLLSLLIPWLKANKDNAVLDLIFSLVLKKVAEVEQTMKDVPGTRKYEIVVVFLHDLLERRGLDFDETFIKTIIEAAVKAVKGLAEGTPADELVDAVTEGM